MSLHFILVQVTYHTNGSAFGPGDGHVAELVKAAIYKTYANPGREDEGISSVEITPVTLEGPGIFKVKNG